MSWLRMFFRNDAVLVLVGDDGRPLLDDQGRAEMKYRESDTKTYRPGLANLSAEPSVGVSAKPSLAKVAPPKIGTARNDGEKKTKSKRGSDGPTRDDSALEVWTDGACSGNPGPMGIGVVVIDGHEREELGEYLGRGTNNIAELVAIERGLDVVTKRISSTTQRVRIHSDSSYAIGLLDKGWKAKANQDLVERIRRKLAAFPAAIAFVKVAGHAGVVENERCDELARTAVERRASIS